MEVLKNKAFWKQWAKLYLVVDHRKCQAEKLGFYNLQIFKS